MPRTIDPVDKHVGNNVRVFRLAKGLSQTELGDAVGVTFQQIQKYEKGTNRIGSGRLAKIAAILDVPVSRFFDTRETPASAGKRDTVTEMLTAPDALRMLRALSNIADAGVRRSLVTLMESIAERKAR